MRREERSRRLDDGWVPFGWHAAYPDVQLEFDGGTEWQPEWERNRAWAAWGSEPDNSALEALADRMAAKREAATHLLGDSSRPVTPDDVVTRARELEGTEVLLTVRGVVDHSRGWTTLILDGIPAVRMGDQFGPRAYLVDIRVVDQ